MGLRGPDHFAYTFPQYIYLRLFNTSNDVHKRCIGNTSVDYCQYGYSNMEYLGRRMR